MATSYKDERPKKPEEHYPKGYKNATVSFD